MNSLFVFSFFVVFGEYSSYADQFSVIKFLDLNVSGSLAAFGDFNADKMVDIFVTDDDGKWVWQPKVDAVYRRWISQWHTV
jgi:hypothetical protein